MATACNPEQIVAALHEQTDKITDIVYENLRKSDKLVLNKIPDGGTVRRDANNKTVIYGEARQASVAYNQTNHDARALEAGKEFKARTLHGINGIFTNPGNEVDDNACHGQVTIDFAQGYRIRGFEDYELSVDTPIKCARELDRQGEAHIRGYFRGMKNQFSSWGMQNFSDNLLNLVIKHGEANASVLGANQFNVSAGGWNAPPLYRITIHFLQDYRDWIMAEMRGKGFDVSDDFMLEVEMPRLDWIDAVAKDQAVRNPSGTSYNLEYLKDAEGGMRGRQFATYGGIKCYFNENPIRGYFRQTGTSSGNPIYSFVRVYEFLNEEGEEGGVVQSPNHDYRRDSIRVDGVSYPMVTLIPHINPRSFKRFGLVKPIKPIGGDNAGVNYDVRVIDGAHLGCNDFNDKFKLAARHEFRFKVTYPEFSGFIAYLSGQRSGYVLEVAQRNYGADPNKFASPEQFATQAADECQTAECAQCGQVSEADGECVDEADVTASVLGLQPAGAVTTVKQSAAAYTLRLAVVRTGGTSGACSVTWTSAHVGTDDNDFLDTTGTLAWEAGDNAPKFIEIPILAGADSDDGTFTVTLTSPVGATLATGGNVTTVTLSIL